MKKASSLVATEAGIDRLTTETDYENIVIVKDNLESVNTVAESIDSINLVAPSIDSVNYLQSIQTKIDSLYADKTTLDSLYADKTTLDRINTSISNVDRVFISIDNLDTVNTSIANVDIVAADISKGVGTNSSVDSAILNALTNANSALTSETNAKNSEIWLNSIYLGSSNTAPTTDKNGNILAVGMLYFDTVTSRLMEYNGSTWVYVNAGSLDGLLASQFLRSDVSGTLTGDLTVTGLINTRDTIVDGTKLDSIETGATADQTATEILTAIKTVDGTGSGLDADTLDGLDSLQFARTDVAEVFNSDVTVTGNLVVSGTTTTIDTANLAVSDALMGLQAGLTTTNVNDVGFILNRGTSGDNAAIVWKEATGRFVVGTTVSDETASGDIGITKGSMEVDVVGNATTATAIATPFVISLSGGTTGSVTLDGSTSVDMAVNVVRTVPDELSKLGIANMTYDTTTGNLNRIDYEGTGNYEVFSYNTSGDLATIDHTKAGVFSGTTTLTYSSGNLISVLFVAV